MSGRASACSLALFLAALLVVGCNRSSGGGEHEAATPEGSASSALGASAGSGANEAAATAGASSSASPSDEEEKPPEGEAPPARDTGSDLVPRPAEMNAQETVDYALYAAELATVDTLLAAAQQDTPTEPVGGTTLRVVFGSNIFGELQDCGCRRNPMGGLARRAALVAGQLSETASPVFHLDTGNALVRDPFPAEDRVESYRLGAEAVVQSYGKMRIDAMAVGVLDVAFGARELGEWSRLWGVPLVSANWSLTDGPLAGGRLTVERGGVRLGIAGASATTGPTNTYFHDVGVDARDALAVMRSIEVLRADNVDAVVLMLTGGVEQASELLTELAPRNALPDVVLVSGSRQLMQEPLWVQGTPVIEAPDRGRQLGVVDLTMVDGGVRFARPVGASTQRLLDLRTTLHARQQTIHRLRATRADAAPENRVRTLETILRRQTAQLQTLSGPMQVDTDNAGAMNQLRFSLAPVALTLDEEREVAAIVERAVARGWTPPHGAH